MVEVGLVKYKMGLLVERFRKCRLFGRSTAVLLLLLIAASAFITQLPGLSPQRVNKEKILKLSKIDRSKLRAPVQLKLAQHNITGHAKWPKDLHFLKDQKVPSEDKNSPQGSLHRETEKDVVPEGISNFQRDVIPTQPGVNNADNSGSPLSVSQNERQLNEVNETVNQITITERNDTEKTGEGIVSTQTNNNRDQKTDIQFETRANNTTENIMTDTMNKTNQREPDNSTETMDLQRESDRDKDLLVKYDFELGRKRISLPLPPDNASFVYYRCGEECQSQGTVDRLRGVLHSYLLSVALDRYFALDINFPCFENILQENEIPWQQSRKLADKLSKTSQMFWKFNVIDRDIFGEDAPLKKAAENRVLRTSQNAMAFYEVAANSKIGYRVLKELKVKKPEEVNFESTARTSFWRLFSLTPKAGKVLTSIFSEGGVDKDTGLVCAHLRTNSVGYHHGHLHGLMRAMQEKAGAFKKAIYFIASDDDIAYHDMKKACKNCHFLTSPEGALQHVMMADDKQCSAVERAVLELVLLSHCDVYYMTLHSGFSMLPRFIRANRTQEATYIDTLYIGV